MPFGALCSLPLFPLDTQTAIDSEGKSALAVCLECREHKWSQTAKLLREAYAKTVSNTFSSDCCLCINLHLCFQATQQSFSFSPSLLSPPERPPHLTRDGHTPSPEPLLPFRIRDIESLSEKGSLAAGRMSSKQKTEKVRKTYIAIERKIYIRVCFVVSSSAG